MDENTVRSLLSQIADSGGPPSSVDIGRARRAGLRRLRLRRIGAPAVSLSAVVMVAGLVASGAFPLGAGSPSPAQATVRMTAKEIAELTNSGSVPRATAEINNAFEVLIQRCMNSKGFKYYPQFVSPEKPGYPGLGYPGLAGVPQATIGLAARKANGYGFHPGGSGSDTRSREERYAAAAGKKYILALDGGAKDRVRVATLGMRGSVSAGGCAGVAKRRLYGSAGNYFLATTGHDVLTAALLTAVTADPVFTAVVGKWHSCMAGRGFHYSSPEELWNKLASQVDKKYTPALRNLEIRVSLADYKCAKTVALLSTVRALQARHARYFRQALAGSLAKLTHIEARALRIAKTLHLHLPHKP
jgi:hypothetical protein